jgi:hypothetical protein
VKSSLWRLLTPDPKSVAKIAVNFQQSFEVSERKLLQPRKTLARFTSRGIVGIDSAGL